MQTVKKIGGKAIIICGARGSGKSTLVKKLIAGGNMQRSFIYDVNGEYSNDSVLIPFQQFVLKALDFRRSIIVFEEATIFIGHSSSSETFREILVRARHTENTIFLIFHSLRTIPRFIYDLCTDIILLRTNDNIEFVSKRFENPHLNRAFERVQKGPKYYSERIKLQ